MATLDEARICSRCSQNGDLGARRPMPSKPGHSIIMCYCRNEACSWYDTGWPIEVDPNGNIPDPPPPGEVRGAKLYSDGNKLTAGVSNEMIQKVNEHAARLSQVREV